MFILDASALAALFNSYDPVFQVWLKADRDDLMIGFPAAAMVEASDRIGARPGDWELLLLSAGVVVLPLDQTAAAAIGTWRGSVAACQAVWESRATGWPVLTCDPKQYEPGEHVYPV
ncbi:hypothetical protein ACFFX1_28790 [Dactylosporangium sucinum]|uniref:PIN domain-containing protein n=1 Tax=Dactylosporangium sucinum TaxID=1424081 RepID=A0A917UBR5_9ACTN|nr:hypothetical protein [Dactylosporangium sucinum]GGM70651.1 hypothetical protein GCM10007977_085590 [Dactylosporangium sucinum]